MATHSYHESTLNTGLADNCERCEEHAEHPFDSLDDAHIRQLVERVTNNYPARTNNEALAMHTVAQAIRAARKLASVGVVFNA